MKAAAYLEFNQNAKEVIDTYQEIFDAEVVCEYTYDKNMTKNPNLIGKFFHTELKIGDLNLYLSDSGRTPSFSSLKFVVEIQDEIEARQVFEKLTQNGTAISDFTKMPFGPIIAQVKDAFGIKWEIVTC